MGCEYNEVIFNSDDKIIVRGRFKNHCDTARIEHGSGGYTGSFAETGGMLLLHTSKIFENESDAYDYVVNTTQKWEEAIGVPLRNEDGTISYYIGAWCSS